MTTVQQKYTRDRIEAISEIRRKAIEEKYKGSDGPNYEEQVLAAHKAGTLKMLTVPQVIAHLHARYHWRGPVERRHDIELGALFVLPKSTKGSRAAKNLDAARKKELSALESEKQRLLDEVMLGSEEKALELLRAFETQG